MARISDTIEEFIKALIREAEGEIELQRNELADYFNCAPSQINYVLATRFNLDRGYYIESRRGGGGYIRVTRIDVDKNDYLLHLATSKIGKDLSLHTAEAIIDRLEEQKIVTKREAALMKSAISDKAIAIPATLKDAIRAKVFKAMIISLIAHGDK
ncbi:MAG: CtsR family transcriptional regulator [Clostridia bacterium]|jgi:transcriptional regulator CtsR